MQSPEPDPIIRSELIQLGRKVRASRFGAGLSQREVEARSGVDQSTISRLENGLAPGLSIRSLARILAALRARPARHD